jgi:hypothetical protein
MVQLMMGDGTVEIAQQDIARYRVAWSDYLRRRDLVFLVCIGYIPWGVIVIVGVKLVLPEKAAYVLGDRVVCYVPGDQYPMAPVEMPALRQVVFVLELVC